MSRFTMCPECGHRMRKVDDNKYECDQCGTEYERPGEGCAACGNPDFPDCKDSCPMFDD